MKTLKQIQKEMEYGDIFTYEKFMKYVEDKYIINYDGIGYLHDGENKTNIKVHCDVQWLKSHRKYPYVCWYNK